MRIWNPFKKKQWFVIGGYIFNRYMLKRVTTIERVQKDTLEEEKGIVIWEFWVHFRELSSQHLAFSTELQATVAHSDICAYVQEVQS